MDHDFTLTNLELRESTDDGEQASGLSHASMKGMFLLTVLELAANGEPRGAVTVLHDAGDTGDRYRDLAQSVAAKGWAVALPDMRGHGRTEGDRGHSAGLAEVVRDVQEIQDHLAYRLPTHPKVLVGQGLGALYALNYALEQPGHLAGLVLVAPLWSPDFEAPVAPKGLGKFFKKLTPRSAGKVAWTGDQLTTDSAQAASWSTSELTHDVVTLRAIQEAQRAAEQTIGRIGSVDVPVLLLHGADDPISAASKSGALSGPSLTVEILEGMRHHPLQEADAAAVHARITTWLDGIS
jgi:acylglycerol lipase